MTWAKPEPNKMLIKCLGTFFGIGFSPVFPGTMASLAGLLIYLVFFRYNPALHLVIVLIVTCAGFCICGRAEKIFGQKDTRVVVIDDLSGMLAGLLFLPYSANIGLLGFLVFRIMDGLKPYPIYKVEGIHGSPGVMLDDLIAGLYTNIVLQLVLKFSSLNFS